MQLKWKKPPKTKQMDETLHAFSDQIILTAKLIIMSAIRSAPHAPAFLHVYINSGHNKVEVKPFSRLLGRQLFLQTLTKLIKQQFKCKFIRWKMLHNALRKCSRKKAIFFPSRFDPLKLWKTECGLWFRPTWPCEAPRCAEIHRIKRQSVKITRSRVFKFVHFQWGRL